MSKACSAVPPMHDRVVISVPSATAAVLVQFVNRNAKYEEECRSECIRGEPSQVPNVPSAEYGVLLIRWGLGGGRVGVIIRYCTECTSHSQMQEHPKASSRGGMPA